MKKSLDIFINGGGEKEVMAERNGSFVLPPSPAVKNHFKELKEKIEEVFHHDHEHHVNGSGTNGVVANGVKKGGKVVESKEGLPRIFEDEAETRTMEVSFYIIFCCFERIWQIAIFHARRPVESLETLNEF